MSDYVRPHRRQPTRLPHSWDSLGKITEVGYHFLLQCMKVKSQSEVTQSCPTLRDPMDCSPPGSSVHGIFQARVLEWGAIAFSNIFSLNNVYSESLPIFNQVVCLFTAQFFIFCIQIYYLIDNIQNLLSLCGLFHFPVGVLCSTKLCFLSTFFFCCLYFWCHI